ncbi:MAG: PD-(D/E)XK nuclease family protein, partial [Clostridia bacterium]|nr:PD-(D/E)XK nuclease family protein [Clostridia bacterium]
SEEEVLFQGFIDLMAITERGVEIVDYKYSSKTKEDLRRHYAPQINLYKKAVAKIMKIAENTVKTTIINIQRGEEIPM